MLRENLDQYYADNVGLIHTVAKKGYARLMAIGASYGYDDLFQELSIIFIKAYDGYDDNTGYKFSTYFMTSAYRQVNKIAEKVEIERIEMRMRSAEELAESCFIDGANPAEMVACDKPTPEAICIGDNSVMKMMSALSPLAHRVLEMTIDPPDFIEREFAAMSAHATHARTKGGVLRAQKSLNLAFVCSVLDKTGMVSPIELRHVRFEIADMAKRSL